MDPNGIDIYSTEDVIEILATVTVTGDEETAREALLVWIEARLDQY